MSEQGVEVRRSPRYWWLLVVIGLVAGFMSGLFGVGGGTVIVPGLVLLLGFEQRRAVGTSLAAIVLPAIVGLLGYASTGHVDWIAGILIAGSAVIGAVVGSWLLQKLPVGVLRWMFIIFLLVVAVQLVFTVPDRSGEFAFTAPVILGLLVLGLITGVLASLLGVGGGIIIVPALVLLFGVSDLAAKGTSLLVILPTSASGTIGNLRRKNADLTAAMVIGGVAALSSFSGVLVARVLDPGLATTLFAVFIVLIVVQMILKSRKK